MATHTTLTTRTALERIAQALVKFAKQQNWDSKDYRILFRVLEDWGRITVMLVADDFKGRSNRDMWNDVADWLDQELKPGGDIGFSIGLSVREKKQVEQGGMYTIPEGYVDSSELLPGSDLGG